MDLLLICRDALESSVIGNIAVAMEAKKAGQEVAVLFTQEALAAMAGQSLRWPPLLESRDARAKVSKNATAMGIEVANQKDSRWTDISRLLKSANDANIGLLACPIWAKILDVDGKLPPEIKIVDGDAMMKAMHEAKTIIGGF